MFLNFLHLDMSTLVDLRLIDLWTVYLSKKFYFAFCSTVLHPVELLMSVVNFELSLL